jgi:hypothetical protein
MTSKISLIAEIDTKPGTCCFIAGSYRIAWVGTLTDKNGEITTCIKWYLPRTREDRRIVSRYRQSLLLNTASSHIDEITNLED